MPKQQIIATGAGAIAYLHDRGFGWIVYSIDPGSRLRIFFHRADAESVDFQIGDPVAFDIGLDDQHRPRAYNVRLIPADANTEAYSTEVRPTVAALKAVRP